MGRKRRCKYCSFDYACFCKKRNTYGNSLYIIFRSSFPFCNSQYSSKRTTALIPGTPRCLVRYPLRFHESQQNKARKGHPREFSWPIFCHSSSELSLENCCNNFPSKHKYFLMNFEKKWNLVVTTLHGFSVRQIEEKAAYRKDQRPQAMLCKFRTYSYRWDCEAWGY